MEKTYTQKVHYRIVIEGDYSCGNITEEELTNTVNDFHDSVWNYIADNMIDQYLTADIQLSDLRTIEE